eukprot:TCONS_00019305-protein
MPIFKSSVPIVKKRKKPVKGVEGMSECDATSPSLDPQTMTLPPIVDSPKPGHDSNAAPPYRLPPIQTTVDGSQLPMNKISIPLKPKLKKKKKKKVAKDDSEQTGEKVVRISSGTQLPLSKTSVPLQEQCETGGLMENPQNTQTKKNPPIALVDNRFVSSIGRKQKQDTKRESKVDASTNLKEDVHCDLNGCTASADGGFAELFSVLSLATGLLPSSSKQANDLIVEDVEQVIVPNADSINRVANPGDVTDSGIKIDNVKTPPPKKLPPLKPFSALPRGFRPKSAIQSDFDDYSVMVDSSCSEKTDSNAIGAVSRDIASSAIANAVSGLMGGVFDSQNDQ